MIRLYVIDDLQLMVEGLSDTVNMQSDTFRVAGGSRSVEEALNKIPSSNAHIIILNLFLEQSDPVRNLIRITKEFPSLPVVIFSHVDSKDWKLLMFKNGARAFLSKSDSHEKIRQRLMRVADGETILPESVAKVLLSEQSPDKDILLSPGFTSMITLLTNGKSIKEISTHLYCSESSVEKRLQKLRHRMKVRTNIELVIKAMKLYPDLFPE